MGMTNQRSSHPRDSGLLGHLGPERFRQANTLTGISPLRSYCLTREAACAAQCEGFCALSLPEIDELVG